MATAAELTFYYSTATAGGIRQASYATALATYAGVPANLAAYRTALIAADVAMWTAINTAATTAGISPVVVPDFQGLMGPSPSATIVT